MSIRFRDSVAPWVHFGILVLLAVIGIFLAALFPGVPSADRAVSVAWAQVPARLYALLPAIAGLAMAGGGVGRGWFHTGWRITLVSVGTMLVLDLVASGAPSGSTQLTHAQLEGGQLVEVTPRPSPGPGGLKEAWVLFAHEREAVAEVLERYSRDHPRRRFIEAYLQSLLLLLPVVLVGLVIGLRAWLLEHVQFYRGRDEWVASLVLAWLLVPYAGWAAFTLSWEIADGSLRGTQGALAPALAYLPFLFIAGLGWRKGWKMPEGPRTRG